MSLYYVIHPFNKKFILFFYPFTWYQSHGLSFCRVLFSDSPLSGSPLLRWTFSVGPSLSDLLRRTFSSPAVLIPITSTPSWNTSKALNNVALLLASNKIKYIFITSLVHMTYMLQLQGSVENHRIFSRYSLIYLLPFVYIILLPFTLYFVSFLFHSFVYIYIGVSILCNTLIQ